MKFSNINKSLIMFFLKDKKRMFIIFSFLFSLFAYRHIPFHQTHSLEHHNISQIILNSCSLAFLLTTNYLFVLWLMYEILFVYKINKIRYSDMQDSLKHETIFIEANENYNLITNAILVPSIIEQKKEKV